MYVWLWINAYAYSPTFHFVENGPNRSSISSAVDQIRHLIADDSIDSDGEYIESDEQSIGDPVIVSATSINQSEQHLIISSQFSAMLKSFVQCRHLHCTTISLLLADICKYLNIM